MNRHLPDVRIQLHRVRSLPADMMAALRGSDVSEPGSAMLIPRLLISSAAS